MKRARIISKTKAIPGRKTRGEKLADNIARRSRLIALLREGARKRAADDKGKP